MKLFYTTMLLLASTLLPFSSFAHFEILGSISFTNSENEVYIRAVLDKKFLTKVLQKEGDCSREMMMKNLW